MLLLASVVCHGQTATATLSGVVSDEAGAVISGAAVTVKNTKTGVTRNATIDDGGCYSFLNVEPGT